MAARPPAAAENGEPMPLLSAAASAWGMALSRDQERAFAWYRDELLRWNQRLNLTAIRVPEEVERRLFVESLALANLLPTAGRLADVGSGAGFPGLPIKIALPHLRVTLIEATGKKCSFLRHVVAELGLSDVEVVAERAEAVGHDPHHREGYDAVTARAVAALPALLELCLPLCKLGGVLVAPKGQRTTNDMEQARDAATQLGGAPPGLRAITIPGSRQQMLVVLVEKGRPTPHAFPRRPGLPAKRPL